MKNRLESILVDCLCDSLQVMLCSESAGAICTINSLISRYSLFNFIKASNIETFNAYLNKIPIWHCLIVDSRCSFLDELFSLIQEIPYWLPVIVLNDSVSNDFLNTHNISVVEENLFIMRNRAKFSRNALITADKQIIFCPISSFKSLFPMLQLHCLRRKLLKKIPVGLAAKAISILFNQNPLTVEQWSATMNSTPRKFQRLFRYFTNYSPKKLITLYHAYRIAFESMHLFEDFGKGVISAYILDEQEKKRIMEYVLTRRSLILNV